MPLFWNILVTMRGCDVALVATVYPRRAESFGRRSKYASPLSDM